MARAGAARLAIVLATAVLVASCAGSGSDVCGAVVTEQLDPQSFIHIVDADRLTYLSDPPTSGAHAPTPFVEGVNEQPLERPLQVSILEQGAVIIQHRDLDQDELRQVATLAGPDVVIAPNGDLDARVVATAWLTKQRCDGVEPATLAKFVTDHADRAPSHG